MKKCKLDVVAAFFRNFFSMFFIVDNQDTFILRKELINADKKLREEQENCLTLMETLRETYLRNTQLELLNRELKVQLNTAKIENDRLRSQRLNFIG